MSGWEIAWIVAGAIAYLAVGLCMVIALTMDGGPDNPVLRALLRLAGAVLWFPAIVVVAFISLLTA